MSSTNSTASGFVELSTHSGSKKKGNWKPRARGPVYFLRYRVPDASRDSGVREVKENLGKAWTKQGRPPAGYYTQKMAEVELRKALGKAEEAVDAKKDRAAAGATFGEACTEFLRFVREERQRDPKTVNDYEGVINGYLLEEFGTDIAAEAVSADQVDEYKLRLIKDGKLSNRTIVRHLTVGHGIYKRAKRKWGITFNPFAADVVERPEVEYDGGYDTLDYDEVELLATCAENAQDAAIFRTAAYTGLRQGELLALRWKWVDFVGGLVHVRKNFTGGEEKVPKGKKVRSVPMTPDVISTLAKLKERENFTGDDDLVFVNETGGHVDHFELRKRFYEALKTAGLRRIKFHDLRHAFGTAAIKKLDPNRVQGYMGHKHYSTTARYLHHKPRREDAAAIAEAFGAPAPERAEATEGKAA